MGFKTDIQIAQECQMAPITEIAAKAGVGDEFLEPYGKYKAKVTPDAIKKFENNKEELWNKNMFGKPMNELVKDSITALAPK